MESERKYLSEGESSNSRVYDMFKSGLGKATRLGLAGLMVGASFLPNKAYASPSVSVLEAYRSEAVGQIENTGLDTDGDGLSDSFEETVSFTDPDNPNSIRPEIPDGANPSYYPETQGKVTSCYSQFIDGRVPHESGKYEFGLEVSIAGDKVYFSRAPTIIGPNGGNVFPDFELWKVNKGDSSTAVQIGTDVDFGNFELNKASSNKLNTGLYIHAQDGKIWEVFDNGSRSREVLSSVSGEKYMFPHLYEHSTLGPHIFSSVVPSSGDIYRAVINAYPLTSGVANPSVFSKVIDQTVEEDGRPVAGAFFPNASPDGKIGWIKIMDGSNNFMRAFVSQGDSLENIVANENSYYSNNTNESERVTIQNGLFLAGWSGTNMVLMEDWEEQFEMFSFDETNLLNGVTDFDLYTHNRNTNDQTRVKKPDNQFALTFDSVQGILLPTNIGGVGTEGAINYATLKSGVYIGPGETVLDRDITYTTDAGTETTIFEGTRVDIPGDELAYLWTAPTFDLESNTAILGVDPKAVFKQIEETPSGTTFTPLVKGSIASTSKLLVNTGLADYLGVGFDELRAVVASDQGIEEQDILDYDEQEGWIKVPVEHFSIKTIYADGFLLPPPDEDEDRLPDAWENHYFGGIEEFGADDDPDGDGVSNFREYSLGTDPNDEFNPTEVPVGGLESTLATSALLLGAGAFALRRKKRKTLSTSNR